MSIVNESKLLFIRNLRKNLSMPLWLFLGMLQPILYLLLYMPLLRNLGNSATLPLGQIAQIFVPGMLVIMSISGLFAGFGFIPEMREGYITRLLVSPISRVSILIGMILNQMFTFTLQGIVLIAVATALGLRTSAIALILSYILFILIGVSMTSLSYIFSIATKSEDGLASLVNTLFLPIMLLSGIMLPISLAPNWLKTAAHFNPFYYAVEAIRALFLGNYTNPFIIEGFLIMIIFVVLTVYFSVRSLKKMAA